MTNEEQLPSANPPKIFTISTTDNPIASIRQALMALEPELIAALSDDDPLKKAVEIAKTQRILTDGVPEILDKRERDLEKQAEGMAFHTVLMANNSDKMNLHLIASYLFTNHRELLPKLTQIMIDREGNHFVNQEYEKDEDYQERERLNKAGRRHFISNSPPPGAIE